MLEAFHVFASPEAWISLLTLAALEIVLGIDNIVFISVLAAKLPAADQAKARRLGLAFALITRLGLLFALKLLMSLTKPLVVVLDHAISGRDLILLTGGVFLIGKSTLEIFESLEVEHENKRKIGGAHTLIPMLAQIMVLDIIFSLDSVITAVGMAKHIVVMAIAMIVAVIVMLIFVNPVGNFINRHPSIKVLALSFMLLVGVLLTAEGLGQHINKGYIYFAMAFSLMVELINMRMRRKQMRPADKLAS